MSRWLGLRGDAADHGWERLADQVRGARRTLESVVEPACDYASTRRQNATFRPWRVSSSPPWEFPPSCRSGVRSVRSGREEGAKDPVVRARVVRLGVVLAQLDPRGVAQHRATTMLACGRLI